MPALPSLLQFSSSSAPPDPALTSTPALTSPVQFCSSSSPTSTLLAPALPSLLQFYSNSSPALPQLFSSSAPLDPVLLQLFSSSNHLTRALSSPFQLCFPCSRSNAPAPALPSALPQLCPCSQPPSLSLPLKPAAAVICSWKDLVAEKEGTQLGAELRGDASLVLIS